jgi:uncharacterized protein (TIGR00290 family)
VTGSLSGRYGDDMGLPTAWMSWSSGKDSALALHATRQAGEVEVVGLLTTVNSSVDRVAMHAVRRSLLEAQADSLNLPLHVVELPWPCPNEVYEERMAAACTAAQAAGVSSMVFGDLFLEDIRAYREHSLRAVEITPLFPLWERPTDVVASDILAAGIRAVLTCVDPKQVPATLAGRWYDENLLGDLPPDADPCGENGEFHTFVVGGPGFEAPLDVTVGEIVERDGFVFADVVPETGGRSPR